MELARGTAPSPKPSTSPGPLGSIPVPSRWMAVEVVAERVKLWRTSESWEGRSLPEMPQELEPWAALTPQGPVLILAPASWGEEWEPGRTGLHLVQAMQGKLQERPSWLHLLQLEPLEDREWLLLASNHGDLYVKP